MIEKAKKLWIIVRPIAAIGVCLLFAYLIARVLKALAMKSFGNNAEEFVLNYMVVVLTVLIVTVIGITIYFIFAGRDNDNDEFAKNDDEYRIYMRKDRILRACYGGAYGYFIQSDRGGLRWI